MDLTHALAWIGGAFVVCSLLAAIVAVQRHRSDDPRAPDALVQLQGYAALAVWIVAAFVVGTWLIGGIGGGLMTRALDAPGWTFPVGAILVVALVGGFSTAFDRAARRDAVHAVAPAPIAAPVPAAALSPADDPEYEGVHVSIEGGPLDGRTAQVRDARESLWLVQLAEGGFEAASAMSEPDVAAGARVMGRYTVVPGSGTLRWYPTEI